MNKRLHPSFAFIFALAAIGIAYVVAFHVMKSGTLSTFGAIYAGSFAVMGGLSTF
jgi:hypothetical protein